MQLFDNLDRLERAGTPIRMGLVGSGHMGSGLIHVTQQMRGMETRAVSDIDVSKAVSALESAGVPRDLIVTTNTQSEAEDALQKGRWVATEDAILVAKLEGIDAVVEATGITEVGASVAWTCIQNAKHIILLNVETDVTVGPILTKLAKQAGCVYTAASGDEPGVCKGLYDFARSLGFEVVCLGKGKNNAIDYAATPDSVYEEAVRRGMTPKMLSAFKDGSKTMVELAAMSNATGLVPDVPGMHGAKADVDALCKVFVPQQHGGILSQAGCVDFSTGKVAPGVFCVITSPDGRIRKDMQFLSMGDGPYYTLYRPYHLCNIETPISVAEACLYGEATIRSERLVSEVVTIAKRDLEPGELIGQIGGTDILGRTFKYTEARDAKAIPLGIATGSKVITPVKRGEMLSVANTAPDADSFVYRLRMMQDAEEALGQ